MKIIWVNYDDNAFKVRVERDADLWYLSKVLNDEDYIEGETQRKIDMGRGEKSDKVRKTFFLGVDVENVEYDPSMKQLRANGRIKKCPDEVSQGRYHSFDIEEGDVITVRKQSLSHADVQQLEEATTPPSNVLLVIVGRDEARLARLTPAGFDVIRVLEGTVEKKAYEQETTEDFHETVADNIEDLTSRDGFDDIVIASPGFWKENVVDALTISTNIIEGSVSRTDKKGFEELVKRPEVKTALESEKNRREGKVVDDLLANVRDDKASYGFKETAEKVSMGAVETLIVTEDYLADQQEENSLSRVESLMDDVESMDGDVIILSGENMTEVNGLGGIAGVLRWTQ